MTKNNEEKKHKKKEKENEPASFLHPDTKKSILGVLFLALTIILALSAFHKAGPVGDISFKTFNTLFGIGFYLLPLISFILAAVFLVASERKIISPTLIGAFLFVISGLGLIDIAFPKKGGIVGHAIGSVEIPFGYIASLVITSALVLASLLITINLPIKIRLKKKKEKTAEEELTEKEIKKIETAETENKKSKKEEDASGTEGKKEPMFSMPLLKKKPKIDFKNYVPPPLSILKSSYEKATAGDLRANANIIKRTFEGFSIPVEMGEINIGPKVTRYTLKPAEGVKLSKIIALNQDLALALAAHPIRIEAPIPGKSLVGIEVPNKSSAIVRLGNLMNAPEFSELGELGVILGRDVTGEPISANISKMPHMLIAGATGSGKSVSIHSIIISLLYKNSPETLRMIMIDPKRVELSVYEGIPHLISPVVTQNKKAVGVFRWAIGEMEKRYELLQQNGARDIDSFNEKVAKRKDGEKLPFIIIIIDELADLMASFGKEVEGYIVRVAQMARAVGIHLILATQRPSVEVITGLIKANITTRVALKVASQIDSRTILDTAGAEKLLGGGDMLFVSPQFSKPKRIQGAFITEDEIGEVASFIRENNKQIAEEVSESAPQFDSVNGGYSEKNSPKNLSDIISNNNIFDQYTGNGDDDDLLEEAIETVRQAGKASASLLQRRLKVGYARAARLLDIMEEKGIIGPGEGAKPREVFLGNEGDRGFESKTDN